MVSPSSSLRKLCDFALGVQSDAGDPRRGSPPARRQAHCGCSVRDLSRGDVSLWEERETDPGGTPGDRPPLSGNLEIAPHREVRRLPDPRRTGAEGRHATMRLIFAIVVFAASLIVLRGTIVGSLFLALFLTMVFSIALMIASRKRKRRAKAALRITDGDIGPYVKHMLKVGNHGAVIACIEEYVPASWEVRRDILTLVVEHGRLQRSIGIADRAGVPMPDEAAEFSVAQADMIADRARRMAFIHQHGAMNPRIHASLNRLATGVVPLVSLSTELRADLAESTGNLQWGAQDERELRRTLERMSNTLRAMNSELMTDGFEELSAADDPDSLDSQSMDSQLDGSAGRQPGQLTLVAKPSSR